MRFYKSTCLVALLCSLCLSAYAEVETRPFQEKCTAGEFKVNAPKVYHTTSAARQASKFNIDTVVEKFRYQAEKIGNTEVKYHVTADNQSYVSLFLESTAVYEGAAHPEKDFHAIVIDKKTGEELPLSSFIKIPNLAYLKEQNSFGNIIVTASDGQTQLDNGIVNELKTTPTEFILDSKGNVYLLATEMTIYATGIPLILLPISNFHAAYVTKG